MSKKLGRNDKCHCKSNKKYKLCCQKKDEATKNEPTDKLNNGHPISSPEMQDCYDCFIELYKYYKIMDITNYLTTDTYEIYQKKHYFDKTIMMAHRNDTNDGVFKTRGPDDTNIMIMFSGSYRCFKYDDLDMAFEKVVDMIEDRRNNR